jgi:hypothetical protein
VLHVTAVLDGAEEAFQIGIGKQLRQPALCGSSARAQLLAGMDLFQRFELFWRTGNDSILVDRFIPSAGIKPDLSLTCHKMHQVVTRLEKK